jgi:hypothetical protein
MTTVAITFNRVTTDKKSSSILYFNESEGIYTEMKVLIKNAGSELICKNHGIKSLGNTNWEKQFN